jgi:hypothetical protein
LVRDQEAAGDRRRKRELQKRTSKLSLLLPVPIGSHLKLSKATCGSVRELVEVLGHGVGKTARGRMKRRRVCGGHVKDAGLDSCSIIEWRPKIMGLRFVRGLVGAHPSDGMIDEEVRDCEMPTTLLYDCICGRR